MNIAFYLPTQDRLSDPGALRNPSLHSQRYDPTVLTHLEFDEQICE